MSTTQRPLTEHERLVIRLIDAGFVRWRIAELSGLTEDRVRELIRTLCERYDCRMELLPEAAWDDVETSERGDY